MERTLAIVVLLCLVAGLAALALRLRARLKHAEMRLPAPSPLSSPEPSERAQADFLAVMSHEIRTPLTAIMGMTGLLLDLPEGTTLGPDERHDLQVILQSGQHLLQLVNNILDFSRLDAGMLKLDETAFDVRALLHGTIDLLLPEAHRKGLTLELGIAPDVPLRAGGDPARLRQVLLNLVGNALKFTEIGGVSVSLQRLNVENGVMRLGFTIADTGIGIAPDALDKLFEPFVQADRSIARRFGGSGLGLAICQLLVGQMGGSLTAESRQGEGSRFHFDIKLRARRASDFSPAGPALPAASVPMDEPAPPAPLRILVADDNPTNRVILMRLLERQGHTIETVANGREAVDAVRRGGLDLVLMDMMMPELDGIDATREIRALAEGGGIPIIGLSANAAPADEAACRAAGMDGFAAKPINSADLSAVIARCLTQRQLPTTATAPLMPIAGENRIFDPAVLDVRVRAQGQAEIVASVASFLAAASAAIPPLRSASDPAAAAEQVRRIATEAAGFGLMRAARTGLDLPAIAGTAERAEFIRQLQHGIDELRAWSRSARSQGGPAGDD
jgi:signal transduction histidine kinase/CheY-like chemotaxis protein